MDMEQSAGSSVVNSSLLLLLLLRMMMTMTKTDVIGRIRYQHTGPANTYTNNKMCKCITMTCKTASYWQAFLRYDRPR